MIKIFRRWLDEIFGEEESVLLLVLIFAVILLVVTMGKVLAPMITSLILAFMLQGLIEVLVKWRLPRSVALYIAFILFVGLLISFMLIVMPLVWQQMINLFSELPSMLRQGQSLLMLVPEKYPELITREEIGHWVVLASDEVGKLGQWLLSFSLSNIPILIGVLIYLVLVPVLVFFLLRDRQQILGWLKSFLPTERRMLDAVWVEMNQQVANYVRGKAIEIVIVGAVSYIAFVVLGLRYAALLGLLVGISVVIPYIGAAVVTVPVAMIAYFQWGWTTDFFTLMIVYGIIQALDGNVLVPLLFSEAVNLHPVAIIMAVLVFGGFWGFWGVFFAIPLATLIKAVINAWPRYNSPQQEL